MSAELQQRIRNLIEKGRQTFSVEGISAVVVQGDDTILLDGFGFADLEKQTPMTADHILPIASTSKAFTATTVALLADEKKLDLDRPIREYMPDFGLSDPIASQSVTARDLLCHRTGLPRHDLHWITWEDISRDELVFKRVRHLPPSKPFRSEWQYQNHMYAAAGCLVERISSKSWEDFVRERIFEPLDMQVSSFGNEKKDESLPYAVLYKKEKDGSSVPCIPESVACIGPAGSIRSSARDMEKWLRFNLSKGKVNEEALLREETFAELYKPNIPYELLPFEIDKTQRIGYALGWFIDSYRGEKVVQHGGNVSGASILVAMIPSKNIGCVLMSNEDSTFVDYPLMNAIFDELLGSGDEKDWIADFFEKQQDLKAKSEKGFEEFYASKIADKPMLHDVDEYCGTYSHPAYGEITVSKNMKNDDPEKSLWVDVHGNGFELVHLHYDIYYITIYETPLPASFQTGVDGFIESFSIQFEPSMKEVITFSRVKEKSEEKPC